MLPGPKSRYVKLRSRAPGARVNLIRDSLRPASQNFNKRRCTQFRAALQLVYSLDNTCWGRRAVVHEQLPCYGWTLEAFECGPCAHGDHLRGRREFAER